MTEVRLNIEDEFIYSASEVICCRICHEAEFESCKPLETPCSCSGTFAHRDCVQRWCDEKGNTICEICLQNFEPGYTAPPPKKASQDTHVTIRESVEASRTNENLVIIAIADEEEQNLIEREYAECSSTADATASMCRTLALILSVRAIHDQSSVRGGFEPEHSRAGTHKFTILLLVRHFIGVLIGETGNYPFTLLTLLLIKACGILLPMYIIMRMIDVVHNSITRQYQDSERDNV